MAWLHQVFREALAAAPRLMSTVAAGDTARADVVGSYFDNVLRLLHGHHEGEDVLMTPKLLERLPEHAEAVTRIGDQHGAVFTAVNKAEDAIAEWRADPSGTNRDRAAQLLAELEVVLVPHLDEEESTIVPLAAQCINIAEWAELPAHGMKVFTGDKPWLITGLVQEQMTPDRIAVMQQHMPPPVLEFWTTQGRTLFQNFIADVRR
jgi:hemerythrin-like domain-containing protein